MRIIIHDEAFTPPQSALLCAIFLLGVEGRHHIRVHPTWTPRDLVLASALSPSEAIHPNMRRWYDTLPDDAKRTVRQALNLGASDAHRDRATLVIANHQYRGDHERVMLDMDLLRRLVAPLMVYLENGINDATFIRRMADEDEQAALRQYEANGWLRFLHSNGNTGIAPLVKSASEADRRRMYMICDRDAANPAMSLTAQRASEVCDRHRVTLHVWARWAIENYIPLPLLGRFLHYRDSRAGGLHAAEFQRRYDAVVALGDERHNRDLKDMIHGEIARLYHWDDAERRRMWPRWRAADPEARREIRELLEELFQRM
jgi:hypothetical protein